jgi:hypothetical protein
MNKLFTSLVLLLLLSPAAFPQIAVNQLPSGTTPGNSDYTICDQSGSTNKCLMSQLATYMSSTLSFVTSVGLSDGSTSPIYTISGSPVTAAGTLTETLNTQSANTVFAGPTSGLAAQPTFRTLVAADLASALASPGTIGGTTPGTATFSSLIAPGLGLNAVTPSLVGATGVYASAAGTVGLAAAGTYVATFSPSATTILEPVTLSAEQTTTLTGQTANTAVVGYLGQNTTAAASGLQQFYCEQLSGNGWGTTAPSSQAVAFQLCDEPVQGTTPTGNLVIQSSINGGAYSTNFSLNSVNGGLSIGASGTYSWSGSSASISQSGNGLLFVQGGSTSASMSGSKNIFNYPIVSAGTTFTVASGTGACATTSTLVGGQQAGDFLCTGTTGTSTATLTLRASTTAYTCWARDITNPTATVPTQTGAKSTTSVTLTLGTVTANDDIQFGCLGY